MIKLIKYLILILFFCLNVFIFAEDKNLKSDSAITVMKGDKIFHNFLYSKNLKQIKNAYLRIITHKNNYRNLILNELNMYIEKPDSMPDALIYLATYIRDGRYLPILINFIENPEYSIDQCIYVCPIIFALTIYSCFSTYTLPDTMDQSIQPVRDLISEINKVRKMPLKSEKASNYIKGPCIDADIAIGEKMTTEQLIILASPQNDGSISRLAAALVLEYRINTEKYIDELYYLAITGYKDASMEFLSSIYRSIYKAEKAKLNSKEHK